MDIRWELLRPPFKGDKIYITDSKLNRVNGYFVESISKDRFIFEEVETGYGLRFIFDKKWINRGWLADEDKDNLKKWVAEQEAAAKKRAHRRKQCEKIKRHLAIGQ